MDIEKIKQSPHFIGTVNSGVLNFLPNNHEDDIVYIEDKDEICVYKNHEWITLKDQTINTGISLLEMNRSLISRLPYYKADDMSYENILMVNNFCTNNEFYMLYGKEIGYFTVFQIISNAMDMSDVLIECLSNIGQIYTIDLTADKTAIEIWIRTIEGGKTTCLYLFPYDDGIVKVG